RGRRGAGVERPESHLLPPDVLRAACRDGSAREMRANRADSAAAITMGLAFRAISGPPRRRFSPSPLLPFSPSPPLRLSASHFALMKLSIGLLVGPWTVGIGGGAACCAAAPRLPGAKAASRTYGMI